jgi:GWxTD domain-containing protein
MRKLLLLVVGTAVLRAAAPTTAWLDLVAPIITPAEKKAYLALNSEERPKFEEEFWSRKAITVGEYAERVAYIDAKFGSTKMGSGANTDQGRVYLALGAPNKVTRIPASRIFWPVEIWYYSAVPGVINTEVRLMFFQNNGTGLLRLYSPTTDTFRALLIPQAAVMDTFSPNDDLDEQQLRNILKAPPGEDEIISAAVNVAAGVRHMGNDEIIGRVLSPSYMLGRQMKTEVSSRLITSHPKLDTVRTVSAFGGSQVDLSLETEARSEIDIEVFEGDATLYRNQLRLAFSESKPIIYTHRLDLLPGSYRVIITADGKPWPYAVEVPREMNMGEIQRVTPDGDVSGRNTPLEFDGRQFELNTDGASAIVPLPHPGKVTWMIRRGGEVLWRAYSEGQEIASVALPVGKIEPGSYKLEALIGDSSTLTNIAIGQPGKPSKATVVSFNANLDPARRFAFVGHQWLLRNNLPEARRSLNASLTKAVTDEARIGLARVDALGGDLDAGRDLAESVLKQQPYNFEALTVLAYIEARFEDYSIAADLYRRALAVQDSPAVRAALSKIPAQPAPYRAVGETFQETKYDHPQ